MKKNFLPHVSIIFTFALIIIIAFIIANNKLSTTETSWLKSGDWVALIIGVISAAATTLLGIITYNLSKAQRKDNIMSQNKLQSQYYQSLKLMEENRKFDRIIQNLHNYILKLESINEKQIDFDIMNEIYYLAKDATKIISSNNKTFIHSQIENIHNRIGKIIIFINHIYTTVVYNKYYIDEVRNLAIKITNLRHELEIVSNHFNYGDTFNISKEEFELFKTDCIKCSSTANDVMCYWQIYLQSMCIFVENVEINFNVEMILLWFKQNVENNKKLRQTIDNINKKYEHKK